MNPSIAHRVTDGQQEELSYDLQSLPKPLDIPIATENLLVVKAVLDAEGIVFWLMFGTMLGAVRDNGFIAHDKDTDIGVFEKDMEKVFQSLLTLRGQGFEIIRTTYDDAVVSLLRNGMYIDFYVMARYGEGWCWGPRVEKKDYFSKFREIPFLGTEFRVPAMTDEFFVEHYGEDWRTPKGGFYGTFNFKGDVKDREKQHEDYMTGGE